MWDKTGEFRANPCTYELYADVVLGQIWTQDPKATGLTTDPPSCPLPIQTFNAAESMAEDNNWQLMSFDKSTCK